MKKKKLMSLFALGCGTLLLVGCGTDEAKDSDKDKESNIQTLSCSAEDNSDGLIMTSEVEFTYDSDKKELLKGTMDIGYEFDTNEYTKEEIEEAQELMDGMFGEMCSTFETQGFENCKSESGDGKYEISMDFDMESLAEEADFEGEEMTLEEAKEYFEDESGMTCKVS